MARVFEVDLNLDEMARTTHTTKTKLDAFEDIAAQNIDEALEKTARGFRDHLVETIDASEIEKRTGDFISSWEYKPFGTSAYRVYSTESDLAEWLEVGTKPHTITGDWLLFEPEDDSGYPRRTNFDEEDDNNDIATEGLIVSPDDPIVTEAGFPLGHYIAKSVNHPGGQAFNYFDRAIQTYDLENILEERIENALIEAAREANLR